MVKVSASNNIPNVNPLPNIVSSNSIISNIVFSIFSAVNVPVISGITGTLLLAHGCKELGSPKPNTSEEKWRNKQAKLEVLAGWAMILFALYYASPIHENALKRASEDSLKNCQANLLEFQKWSQGSFIKLGGSFPG